MRTRRYHFGDRPSRTLLPFLRISPERRMVEREIFPSRMSLSLSFFAPNEGSSARQKHRRRRSLSTPLSRFRFDRGEETTRRVFVLEDFRARVFKFHRWENSIPKSFALCLCPVLLSRQKDARKTSPASTRALSTVSQCPRVSLGRVFASVKRERNDPKFVRKLLLFFPRSFFILQLSAHNFHRGAGESETTTRCEILLFEPNTHREKTTTTKRRRKKRTL